MVPQSSSDGEGEQDQNQAGEVTEEGVVVVTHSDDEGESWPIWPIYVCVYFTF